MAWFLVIMFLSLTSGFLSSEAGHHHRKLPSAVVVGTVYCDTCFQQDFSMGSHFISGASVAVECKDDESSANPRFSEQVKTNNHGEFRVQLPFSVSKQVKTIKECTVKLISSSEPYCAVASSASSSSLLLKSRKQGLHIFSAGFFSFKPLKQPNLCNQKPRVKGLIGKYSLKNFDPSFPPPLMDPNPPSGGLGGLVPNLPLLPTLPGIPQLPQLPPLLPPLLPGTPRTKESIHTITSSDNDDHEKVDEPETFNLPPMIPNPLLQPPSPATPLLPNPFLPPSPATPLLPNNPFQPPNPTPSSPLFPFPTLPVPPPSFPFPFPPVFPPPPASSSEKSSSP